MDNTNQLYMLKDVARLSGQSIYTIKFYLKLGLIHEVGRSPETRFRYFDDSTVERLARIRALRKAGKRLAEILHLLQNSHGAISNIAAPSPIRQATNPSKHP